MIDLEKDPRFQNIPPNKLKLLKTLFEKNPGNSQNEMITFLLEANKQAKLSGLSFTKEETELMIDVLSADMSPKEKQKIMLMKRVFQKMNKN